MKKLRFYFWGLRKNLLALILLIYIPVLCNLLYTGYRQRQRNIEEIGREAEMAIQLFAEEQLRIVESSRQLLKTLSHIPAIQNLTLPRCNQILREIHDDNPQYATMVVADSDGMIRCCALPLKKNIYVKDRSWFQRVWQTKEFVVGQFIISRTSQKASIPFAFPVLNDDGELLGVVGAAFNLDCYRQIFSRVRLPYGSRIFVTDCKGTLLYRRPASQEIGIPFHGHTPPEIAEARQGRFRLKDPEGTERLCWFQHLTLGQKSNRLCILISISEAEAFARANEMLIFNIMLLSGFTLVSVVLAWFFGGRYIVGPVRLLVQKTQDIAKGDLSLPEEMSHPDGELGLLAEAFDAMTATLAKRAAEQRETQEALRQSESLYRTVIMTVGEGIILQDAEHRILAWNKSAERILGISAEEVLGQITDHKGAIYKDGTPFPPESHPSVLTLRSGVPCHNVLMGVYRPDGELHWLSVNTWPLFKEGENSPHAVVISFADITDRKHAEDALQRELEINTAIAGLSKAMLSPAYDVNKIAEEILKCAKKVTRSEEGCISTLMAGTDQDISPFGEIDNCLLSQKVHQITSRLLSDKTRQEACRNPFLSLESFCVHDLQENDISVYMSQKQVAVDQLMSVPIRIEDKLAGRITLFNAEKEYTERDFSAVRRLGELFALALHRQQFEAEKLKLQHRLRQAQKMESLGTLAGGIAHDFNNVLFPIIGYTEMALDDVPADSLTRDNLGEVLKAADRAREMVEQILTFSRQTEHEKKELRIQPILKEALKLLRPSLPATIEIRCHIEEACGMVLADPTQIHQIIINLCTNAYHAMREKGGVLELILGNAEIRTQVKNGYPTSPPPGTYLRLGVRDTGHGMSSAIMDRILDPYFTTKPLGQGTGMGLSVVHGIVKSHGGYMTVSSRIGKGSAFEIFLPLTSPKETDPEAAPSREIPTGHERILVVDDEMTILRLQKQVLERLGYRVKTVTNGLEAVNTFREDPAFDLVITDQTMPEMTGDELAQELLLICPEIPIILCTGFSETVSEEQARSIGIRDYLIKPIVKDRLARTVRRALGDKRYQT